MWDKVLASKEIDLSFHQKYLLVMLLLKHSNSNVCNVDRLSCEDLCKSLSLSKYAFGKAMKVLLDEGFLIKNKFTFSQGVQKAFAYSITSKLKKSCSSEEVPSNREFVESSLRNSDRIPLPKLRFLFALLISQADKGGSVYNLSSGDLMKYTGLGRGGLKIA